MEVNVALQIFRRAAIYVLTSAAEPVQFVATGGSIYQYLSINIYLDWFTLFYLDKYTTFRSLNNEDRLDWTKLECKRRCYLLAFNFRLPTCYYSNSPALVDCATGLFCVADPKNERRIKWGFYPPRHVYFRLICLNNRGKYIATEKVCSVLLFFKYPILFSFSSHVLWLVVLQRT